MVSDNFLEIAFPLRPREKLDDGFYYCDAEVRIHFL